MINLFPSSDYRYAVRRDDSGTDVAVLQLNLPPLKVDGIFGKGTESRVLEFQKEHDLVADGIAGLQTQQKIIQKRSKESTLEHELPRGLLKSIASNESGFALSAAGPHGKDEGWDIGAFCRSSGPNYPSQDFLQTAYNVKESAEWTANHVIEAKKALKNPPIPSKYFTDLANNDKDKFMWQLAILSHNWPVGARNIASRGSATYDDDAPTDWIIFATNGRLRTPREWCLSYIYRATVYVRW
jgi:hypothetical protein